MIRWADGQTFNIMAANVLNFIPRNCDDQTKHHEIHEVNEVIKRCDDDDDDDDDDDAHAYNDCQDNDSASQTSERRKAKVSQSHNV